MHKLIFLNRTLTLLFAVFQESDFYICLYFYGFFLLFDVISIIHYFLSSWFCVYFCCSFFPKLIYEGICAGKYICFYIVLQLAYECNLSLKTFLFYVFHSFCDYLQNVLHIIGLIQHTVKLKKRLPIDLDNCWIKPYGPSKSSCNEKHKNVIKSSFICLLSLLK